METILVGEVNNMFNVEAIHQITASLNAQMWHYGKVDIVEQLEIYLPHGLNVLEVKT